ncbi:MAG: hypothetical protein JNL98_19355 [Bryobacterales bacterium]|nr:hypothetical protein [Bryobacterales bacterium]
MSKTFPDFGSFGADAAATTRARSGGDSLLILARRSPSSSPPIMTTAEIGAPFEIVETHSFQCRIRIASIFWLTPMIEKAGAASCVTEFSMETVGTLVWIVAFICLIVSTYRVWLQEHGARLAEKLDALLEDAQLLRDLWEKIQDDHKDSNLVVFPLSGFDIEKWEEVHKQLLRLYFTHRFTLNGAHRDSRIWGSLNIFDCQT